MLYLDILPRLVPDAYFATRHEAFEEVCRRKASPVVPDAVTRLDESPYGGFRVYTVSLSHAMEMFADFTEAGVSVGGGMEGRRSSYRSMRVGR